MVWERLDLGRVMSPSAPQAFKNSGLASEDNETLGGFKNGMRCSDSHFQMMAPVTCREQLS